MRKFYPNLLCTNPRCKSYLLILLFAGLLPFFAQSQCLQKSLKFDGHTNFVDMGGCPSLTVQGALTMEAWINPVTYGKQGIGGVGGMIINNEGQYELSVGVDGKLWYALANTSPGWHWTSTDYAIPLNTWTHVALVYDYSSVTDMGEIRVYINGNTTPVYTFLGSGTIVDIYPGSFNPVLDKFNVGCRQNGLNDDFFEGTIDEVRVWKTAVSAANLNQWYHTSVTAAHTQYAGIVGYWRMDEGTGNTTYDALGRNNGNLVNGPVWVAGIDMGPNDCSIPVQIPCGATPVMFSNVQKTDISCAGGNTGTATVTFSGGVAPFKYSLNGGVPVSIPGSPFTITGLSAGMHTIQVIDVFGNSASTSVTIIAGSDNEAPNFSRPPDITVYANATCGYNALPAATGDVTNESDNCTTGLQATYTDVVTNGSCGNSRIITRTWHLSDANGNTAADQVQIITILDNTPPTFTRPANKTIFITTACQYDASPAATGDVTNEADNCSTGLQATYTDVVTNGSCGNSKVINRTWHLVDGCGNAAADQVQVITVNDNTAPTFTKPANTTIFTTANCQYNASPAATGDVTNEADNCSTGLQATYTDVVSNGPCANSKVITRTWHLVDGCGNAAADQVQVITVSDNTPPTFTKPANKAISFTSGTLYDASPAITGDVTNEADNCSTGLQATYTDVVTNSSCGKVINRTWHLADACGNAAADQVQVITVGDNTPPTFTKPANKTIYTTSTCTYNAAPSVTGDVTNEADNSSTGLQATYTDVVTNAACGKVINRTWHLVDGCGNAAADQVQVITVSDNIAPTFTRPANKTIYCTTNSQYDASPSITGDVTNEADNCSTGLQATYTDVVTNASCGKVINRTWHLIDACGNAAADQVQVITVGDNTPPTFTKPANTTIYTNATCGYNAAPSVTGDVTNEADNNSTGLQASYTDVVTAGSCTGSKIITRTWRLVDACGNAAANQVQVITVTDNTAPTFTRPADITIPFTTINTYNTPTPATTGDVTNEADNCSTGLQATYTDVVSPCGNTITITRTWSLVDKCGNKAADQVQTITVSDNATQYIIYAQKEASFAELTAILGAVGVTDAAGKADFKSYTYIPNTYFVKAKNITVGSYASIPNQTKLPASGGPNPPFFSFAGTTSSLSTYTVSTSTTTPLTANYKYLTIKKNVSVTLKGTLYGTIDIEDGAQVTFDLPGNIVNIENLNVKGDVKLTRLIFKNPTSVRVKTKVDIQNNCRINESGPRVTFYLADDGQDVDKFIVHGKCTWVTANIYMKSGRIRLYDCDDNNPTIMTGWFIAGRVLSQSKAVLWNSYGCTSSCYDATNVNRNTGVTESMVPEAKTEEAIADGTFTVNVYPNPSTTDFRIGIKSSSTAPVLIRLTDANGNLVSITPVQKETVVTIGKDLRSGIFFAEVIQGNNRKVVKLIKIN